MLSRTKFQMNRTFFTQTFSKVSSETNPVQEFRIKIYETYVKSFCLFVHKHWEAEEKEEDKKAQVVAKLFALQANRKTVNNF